MREFLYFSQKKIMKKKVTKGLIILFIHVILCHVNIQNHGINSTCVLKNLDYDK